MLFKSQFRLWSGCYMAAFVHWADNASQPKANLNMAKGVQCGDRSWRLELRRAIEGKDSFCSIETLWDVKKGFDSVDRGILPTCMVQMQFPACQANLCCQLCLAQEARAGEHSHRL